MKCELSRLNLSAKKYPRQTSGGAMFFVFIFLIVFKYFYAVFVVKYPPFGVHIAPVVFDDEVYRIEPTRLVQPLNTPEDDVMFEFDVQSVP